MSPLPEVPGLAVERLGDADLARLAELCAECTAFFELVEGEPGGEATAAELLGPLPERVAHATRHVFGFAPEGGHGGALAGLAELLEGHPGAGEWYVGLLVFVPRARGAGLGRAAWLGLRAWLAARGARTVRLLVQRQNPGALAFWERQGFTAEGEKTVRVGSLESVARVLRLDLGPGGGPRR